MEDNRITKLRELENYKKVLAIYDIFEDYFGEERVDLQGFYTGDSTDEGYILVWWPNVRITNENDRYVDIKDLYAKITINIRGSIVSRFLLNRAHYTLTQFLDDYMHSHISHIPKSDFTQFQQPCLGQGPIRDTISSLAREYDEDLWRLFVVELDKYVHVESLEGTPYHRLENVGHYTMDKVTSFKVRNKNTARNYYDSIRMKNLKYILLKFVRHLVGEGSLRFNYINGTYSIGMSFTETVVTISNSFINWYNNTHAGLTTPHTLEELVSKRLLLRCIVTSDAVMYPKNYTRNLESIPRYEGEVICAFKEEPVKVHIVDDFVEDKDRNKAIILNLEIISHIIFAILNVLNYRYGRLKDPTYHTTETIIRYL